MNDVMMILLACAGGALGAVCRAVCTDLMKPRMPQGFPYPTLIINLVSCFAIGCIVATHPDDVTTALVCTGFLGGFSTVSTMNYEAVTFFIHRFYGRCAAYLGISYGSCLLACAAGLALFGAF